MSSTIYRLLESPEIAAASVLACEVFDQFVAPQYQLEGVAEFHRYASVEAMALRHESGHVTIVAEESGGLAGMLQLREGHHVAMLFVRPDFQRRGIGRGLLSAAAALAGGPKCQFTVNSSPNAVSAYERLGFRVTAPEQCLHGIRFVPMQRLLPDDPHNDAE